MAIIQQDVEQWGKPYSLRILRRSRWLGIATYGIAFRDAVIPRIESQDEQRMVECVKLLNGAFVLGRSYQSMLTQK